MELYTAIPLWVAAIEPSAGGVAETADTASEGYALLA
jgi:hypothetical protein